MGEPAKTTVGGNRHRAASDMPSGGWVDRFVPRAVRPYVRLARLDRPIGTWLLLLPCWWGLSMASGGMPDIVPMALFALGAVVMRAAGCTLNDIVDRDIDRRVARTATRPLAAGQVSRPAATAFLALLLALGLAILLTFNAATIMLGLAALPLVAVYPFAKRVTYWPQAVLGLTFNWGALMGWAAATGTLAPPAFMLYAAGFFWTLGYDTIYAHQDKDDDIVAGVKSAALKLGSRTRPWLAVFYLMTTALLVLAGWRAGLGVPYYMVLLWAAVHLGWQVTTVRLDEPADCLAKFRSNKWFGLIVVAAVIANTAAE